MNRVLLDLGFVQIYWYSICILIGLMFGMFLVYKETIKKEISEKLVTNLIFYTIIIAIIGARLYYVIFDWKSYAANPVEILEIWNGGLAIHGAIIFGGLFLIYYTRHHKMDTLKVLDICAVGLIIGQAIGRWGNFFNSEVYGGVVSEPFLKGLFLPRFIIDGMHIDGAYHHPLFLYESLWCILGFIILLIIRRRKYIKTGQIFGIYCMWYSIGRFFLEGMRVEKYNLMVGPIKVAQVVSIGMFLVGLFYFLRRIKTSRFEYLYNDENISIETNQGDSGNKNFFGIQNNYQQPIQKEVVTPNTQSNTYVPSNNQDYNQNNIQDNNYGVQQAQVPVYNDLNNMVSNGPVYNNVDNTVSGESINSNNINSTIPNESVYNNNNQNNILK